ncbi:hypothetical protein [Martelella sp. AMO21009]
MTAFSGLGLSENHMHHVALPNCNNSHSSYRQFRFFVYNARPLSFYGAADSQESAPKSVVQAVPEPS